MEGNEALHKFIKSIPLFAQVEPAEMSDILRLLRPVELGAGEVLFREGVDVDHVDRVARARSRRDRQSARCDAGRVARRSRSVGDKRRPHG